MSNPFKSTKSCLVNLLSKQWACYFVDDSYKCHGLHHEAASAHGLSWHHMLGVGLLVELRVLSSCCWY